jgi:hypothetical protein
MYGPTCIFWANLTPFSLKFLLSNVLPDWLDLTRGATDGAAPSTAPGPPGTSRARSYCRFVLPFIHFMAD